MRLTPLIYRVPYIAEMTKVISKKEFARLGSELFFRSGKTWEEARIEALHKERKKYGDFRTYDIDAIERSEAQKVPGALVVWLGLIEYCKECELPHPTYCVRICAYGNALIDADAIVRSGFFENECTW